MIQEKEKREKNGDILRTFPVCGYCLVMAKSVPLFHLPLEKIRERLGL
jgi:hypothetical protein